MSRRTFWKMSYCAKLDFEKFRALSPYLRRQTFISSNILDKHLRRKSEEIWRNIIKEIWRSMEEIWRNMENKWRNIIWRKYEGYMKEFGSPLPSSTNGTPVGKSERRKLSGKRPTVGKWEDFEFSLSKKAIFLYIGDETWKITSSPSPYRFWDLKKFRASF